MSTRQRLWTPADLDAQPVSWLDCDTCRVDTDTGGIVGVYDKEGHSFRPMSGYNYAIGESHINGRRWLGGVSPKDTNLRLSLGCMTASGWFQDKPGVTVVGTWWRFDSTDYQTHLTINNVDASGAAGTTTAQQMVNIAAANTTNANLNYCWRRLTTDTRSNSTRITGLPKECGLVLSSRFRSTDAKASFHAGVSTTWDGLGAQSGITTGMLAGCSRTAYQVMYGFQRANLSGSTSLALGESLIYDRALSDADVAMVEGYLAHRWGVTDSLPDSHPYKSAPPVVDEWDGVSLSDDAEAALDDRAAPIGTLLLRQDADGNLRLAKHKAQAGLALDDTLASAVLVSLFSDAPASEDEAGLLSLSDRRGWWADALAPADGAWGSRLWALDRSKPSAESARQAEERAKEALSWMIADGIAASIDAEASWVRGTSGARLELAVTIRPTPRLVSRYGEFWRATYEL